MSFGEPCDMTPDSFYEYEDYADFLTLSDDIDPDYKNALLNLVEHEKSYILKTLGDFNGSPIGIKYEPTDISPKGCVLDVGSHPKHDFDGKGKSLSMLVQGADESIHGWPIELSETQEYPSPCHSCGVKEKKNVGCPLLMNDNLKKSLQNPTDKRKGKKEDGPCSSVTKDIHQTHRGFSCEIKEKKRDYHSMPVAEVSAQSPSAHSCKRKGHAGNIDLRSNQSVESILDSSKRNLTQKIDDQRNIGHPLSVVDNLRQSTPSHSHERKGKKGTDSCKLEGKNMRQTLRSCSVKEKKESSNNLSVSVIAASTQSRPRRSCKRKGHIGNVEDKSNQCIGPISDNNKSKTPQVTNDCLNNFARVDESLYDEDYMLFIAGLQKCGDSMVLNTGGISVEYEENPGVPFPSEESSILSDQNPDSVKELPNQYSEPSKEDSEDDSETFEEKLRALLCQPYSKVEHELLLAEVSVQKSLRKQRHLRNDSVFYDTTTKGKSYLDHFPDFAKELRVADPVNALNLLRGFFCWLQSLSMEGAFKPWITPPDYFAIVPADVSLQVDYDFPLPIDMARPDTSLQPISTRIC